jgi:hypothetical protein
MFTSVRKASAIHLRNKHTFMLAGLGQLCHNFEIRGAGWPREETTRNQKCADFADTGISTEDGAACTCCRSPARRTCSGCPPAGRPCCPRACSKWEYFVFVACILILCRVVPSRVLAEGPLGKRKRHHCLSVRSTLQDLTVPQKGFAKRGSNRQITKRPLLSHF